MSGLFRKYGFAAVVGGALALGAGAAVLKGLSEAATEQPAAASAKGKGAQGDAAKGGAPAKGKGGGGRGETPLVTAQATALHTFADDIQAIGTAEARESIVVTSKVTDAISAIRFDSGDYVRKGQVLVELSSVEQRADLAEAEAQVAVARQSYERFKELLAEGFAPRARYEEAEAAYARAEARVQALRARIGDRTIRAPFSGVMGLRTASPGALARPGEPIATLDDVSVIKLDFTVPQTQLSRIAKGADVVARSDAAPGRSFAGRVDDIDSRIDPTTRTVRVRAILPNGDGALKPGMLLTVLMRANPRQAPALPENAVLERVDGQVVFKVEEKDGRFVVALTPVQTGQRSGGMIEILAGLAAGDKVVVDGVQRVRPGQGVRLTEPAAAPPPAAAAAPPTRS